MGQDYILEMINATRHPGDPKTVWVSPEVREYLSRFSVRLMGSSLDRLQQEAMARACIPVICSEVSFDAAVNLIEKLEKEGAQ